MNSFNWLGFVVVGLTTACSSERAVEPNVLLILTDDQGWGDFGFNGNSVIETPVLDSLCGQGAHMTNFYVSPLSASTRAGILTGRDHLSTGAMYVTRSSENMDSREQTLTEVFKANGYSTGCFGKWHNGAHYPQDPNGQGFDEFVGFCAGHLTNYFDSRLQHNQEFFNAEGYITDVLTDKAMEFIDQSVEGNRPFFCYVPYNAPHAPYQVPDEYYDKYASLEIEGDEMTAAVYAMCENVDFNVGRLLRFLSDKGLDENTLIVFLSDNGPNNPRYNGELRGRKSEMYEGGFKVPCLFYWKGHIESVELPQTASYVDIMPTILDICGLESTPQDGREFTGISLKGILTGKESKINDRYLFTHRSTTDLELHPYNGAIFDDRYKLITFDNGRHELYDKLNDPSESQNIIERESLVARQMVAIYDDWFADILPQYNRSISRTAHIGLLNTPIELPAHEAIMSGRTRYYTNVYGWAGDWMVDMSPEDTIYWDVIVDSDGHYEVTLQYSSIAQPHKVRIGDSLPIELAPHKAEKIESPDRSPRVEAYEQVWGEQVIGTLHLNEGESQIKLHFDANESLSLGSLEIKGVKITKL